MSLTASAQTGKPYKLTGKVVDEKSGDPLAGATIVVKKTGAKEVTSASGADGNFSLELPGPGPYQVTVNYVGYEARTITTEVLEGLTVRLSSANSELNGAVVIGYGRVKKRDLTGSVATAPIADMLKAPVRSFDEALAGRVPGVQVTSADGQPGANISIVIRGANSITQDNSPLYVIDGFPIENPNNNVINPEDIESIEVLKDASSTAIYGARGANGVIIITTKRGKLGAATINYSAYYGVQNVIKKMKLMDAADFVKYQLEFNASTLPYVIGSGAYPTPNQLYLSGGTTLKYYQDTAQTYDWQSQVLKTAPIQSHDLSITGGTDKTKYALTGSVLDQDGIIINSSYKRYQGRAVIEQTVGTKLKVGINANYSYLLQSGLAPNQSTNSSTTNLQYSVWGYRPVAPSPASQQATGIIDLGFNTPTDQDVSSGQDYRFNPVTNLKNLDRKNRTTNLTANAYAEYTIIPDLVLRVTGGVNSTLLRNEQFNNSMTSYGNSLLTSNGPNGSVIYNETNNWLNENYFTYNKVIGKGTLNVVGGMTEQGNKTASYGVSAIKVPNESLGISGLNQGTPLAITSTSSLWAAVSYLGRVNYTYASRYLFTATWRADGSSKFAAQNHWGYFPSGAFAWRFSNESFMENVHWLSDGKFRVSYGNTGNNRVSDFAYLSTYSQSPSLSSVYTFNNNPITGAVPVTIGNTNLKWETTAQLDLGIDLSMLQNRVTFTGDVYRKTTKNLLLNASVPTSSGYNTVYENIGSVRNQGLELGVTGIIISKGSFTWNSSFNISFNQSKVLALAQNQQSLLSSVSWDNNWASAPAYIAKVGKPLGEMYGYVSDGVYQYKDFTQTTAGTYILKDNVTTNGNARANIQPGDIKYKDINGDNVVNASDYTIIGRGLPVHYGGFSNNFTYKGFDLNIFFQWSYGNQIQNVNNMVFDGNLFGKTFLNQFAAYDNRWTPTHTNTNLFRTNGYYGGGYSSRTVEDGSYLRLKTASLGYRLPPSLLKRMRINNFRVYASAQNVFTLTKYSGQDPEVNAYSSVLTSGFDYSPYPRARTLIFGASINF